MHSQRIYAEETAKFVDVKQENDENARVHIDERGNASKVC